MNLFFHHMLHDAIRPLLPRWCELTARSQFTILSPIPHTALLRHIPPFEGGKGGC